MTANGKKHILIMATQKQLRDLTEQMENISWIEKE